MRFSEAMMLGLPEIFFRNDYWLQGGWDAGGGGEKCAGCLVGAALWAEGFRKEPLSLTYTMRELWPWTKEAGFEGRCFVCDFDLRGNMVATVATHLASHYEAKQITAEQVADVFREWESKYEKEEKDETERDVVAGESDVAAVAGSAEERR